MMRIALFLLTNLSVMLVFGMVLSITGIKSSSIYGLITMAGLFGCGGALVSLLMSKGIALRSVGGKIIATPKNKMEKWILEVVKFQSNKMGIVMPQVAIYHAPDINAFATGAIRNASLIAVSTGLLKNMSYDEAEAVIAHEISHIANGDMVTMTMIQGIVNTFVIFFSRFLSQITTELIGKKDKISRNGNPIIYFFFSLFFELIFGIFASIITMWFSRYREFYADAGSAKLVGSKNMIAALKRIKNSSEPQEASSIIAFCINGKNHHSYIRSIFMSHPSLDSRIEALTTGKYIKKEERE